jgi:hypothetical protein
MRVNHTRGHYALLCILLLLASCTPVTPSIMRSVQSWVEPATRLITSTIVGRPITAGDYLFWYDRRGGGAIYGYDRPHAREFVVQYLGPDPSVAYLTSDGQTVAWLDARSTSQYIQAYHLPTHRAYTIRLRSAHPAIADLTLDRGTLYYWDHAPDHRGIFAYYLTTGSERRLSTLPRPTARGRLAAADGVLVWSEYTSQGAYLPPRATLYMYRIASGGEARIAARGQPWSGAFSNFSVAGDHIVWSFDLEQQVWLYTISTGTPQVVSIGAASHPVINGLVVAWNVWISAQRQYGIAIYDLVSGARAPIIAADRTYVDVQALDEHTTVVFTVDHRPTPQRDLYLTSIDTHGLHVAAATPDSPPAQAPQPPAPPVGQVQVAGTTFVIDGAPDERWTFNGVHFILPSRGINGGSFTAEALVDPGVTVERREWLDRAQQIGAKTIRIYVDMPGDTNLTTSPRPEQIYWFARDELAPRGLRLALVIHNSGRFDDSDGRKMAWLNALLDCFGSVPHAQATCEPGAKQRPRNQTQLLAYINADNEINIHRQPLNSLIPGNPYCRPDDSTLPQIAEDCFDHPNPEKRRRYIREALGWVALVRQTVKQHSTGHRVLVTVGMSVDLEKDILGDRQSAVVNYFARVPGDDDRPSPALVDLVDFLAPHSYTALPHWEIIEPIERTAPFFNKPILLEEFGYPTDPITQPDPRHPNEYKETSLNIHILDDGTIKLTPNPDGLPPGEDINKLCRYLPKLGRFGESSKRCNPSAPYVVQLNLEAIFDTQEFAGGIAFMLADSNEKDDNGKVCQAADAQRQVSKNLFTGLFATNRTYRCGGTVNIGRGQIKNTGYRVCVAYQTGNPQLGDYHHRVPSCEIDLKLQEAETFAPDRRPEGMPAVEQPQERKLPTIAWIGIAIILIGVCLLGVQYFIRRGASR